MDPNPLPPPHSPPQRPLRQVVDPDQRPGSSKGSTGNDVSASPRQPDLLASAHTQQPASSKKRKTPILVTVANTSDLDSSEQSASESIDSSSCDSSSSSSSTWPSPSTSSIPLTQSWSQSATFPPTRALPSLETPITTAQSPFGKPKPYTRKPLDRPIVAGTPRAQIKNRYGRSRAHSLPTMRPVLPTRSQNGQRPSKKLKLSHPPQVMLPSESRSYGLVAPPTSSTGKHPIPRPFPPLAGPSSALWPLKPLTYSTACQVGILLPQRYPPISLTSLATLEAAEILRFPQLRHDLLFDNLAFRPLGRSGSGSLASCASLPAAKISPEPSQARLSSNLYWEAVDREIATGCRCLRWDMKMAVPDQSEMAARRAADCVCGGWMREVTEVEWTKSLKHWPSRIPLMINSLREIILSLMASTTPCTTHYQHPLDPTKSHRHTSRCPPLTTHVLVPGLYAALDPDFILSQVRYGQFNTDLFKKLGAAMKVHCAPIRDRMVDEMVKLATEDGMITEGLQRCFDCVEVMKLDIANHQLQAIRPWLTSTAIEFEYSQFKATLEKAKKDLKSSGTIAWIKSSVEAEVAKEPAEERERLLAIMATNDNRSSERVQLVVRGYVVGLMDLIVNVGTASSEERLRAGLAWSSTSLRDGTVRYAHPQRPADIETADAVDVPESLKLDAMRLGGFHADIIDITVLNMLLLGYRQICRSRSLPCTNEDLAAIRAEIVAFVPNPSAHFHIGPNLRHEAWHKATTDLTILMATHAVSRINPPNSAERVRISPVVRDVSRTLNHWIVEHMVPTSLLFCTVRSRVRDVIQMSLSIELTTPVTNGDNRQEEQVDDEEEDGEEGSESHLTNMNIDVPDGPVRGANTVVLPSATAIREAEEAQRAAADAQLDKLLVRYGLDVLRAEVDGLSKRIVRIAMFNLQVFGAMYEQAFVL